MDVPKSFNESHRETIEADPTVVDLYNWCPYYYDFGLELAKLPQLPSDAIRVSLATVSMKACHVVGSLSSSSSALVAHDAVLVC